MKGRGGYIENVWFENIAMDSIYNEAVIITMDYKSSSIAPRSDSLPTVKNIHYKNIVSTNSKMTVNIVGIDNRRIDSVFFDNCRFTGRKGFQIENAENITFENVEIESGQTEPLSIIKSKNISFNRLKVNP